jgi:hypothetical protein
MALEIHTWRICGVSPLLQNNPAGTMSSEPSGITAGKKVYKDEDEAKIRTYTNDEGRFVHPTAAFRAGMLVAASGRKISKKSAKAIIAGSVFPAEVEAVLIDDKDKPLKSYALHKCRVVIGKSGVLRVRPMYKPWNLLLALEVDRELMPDLAVVTEILNVAGRIVGVGDNRPDTSKGKSGVGTFGRYQAKLVN